MNNILSISALVLVLLMSCEDDSSSGDNLSGTVLSGTWNITSFVEDESDETSHFSGYDFTFGPNDVLTASNGTNTYTGTWNISGNSNDDSPEDQDLNIFFAGPDKFEDISEDWEILSRNAVKVELRHVSGGDGSIDYLTFEKN